MNRARGDHVTQLTRVCALAILATSRRPPPALLIT
jgi:hypothetical protein